MTTAPDRRTTMTWRWLARAVALTVIGAWPLLLAAIEPDQPGDMALVGLAVVALVVPVLALAIAQGGSRRDMAASRLEPVQSHRTAPAPRPSRIVPLHRRPRRIVTPRPCCNCGHNPRRPRRRPRIVRKPIRRPSVALIVARAADGQHIPKLRRPPRLVYSH